MAESAEAAPPITGRIVRILDGHTVVINVGKDAGVKGPMRFEIFTPYDKITDPESGIELGRYRRSKGIVIVQEIAQLFSVAAAPAITEQVVEQIGGMFGLGNERTRRQTITKRELHVASGEIEQLPTGLKVRVGDIVEQIVPTG